MKKGSWIFLLLITLFSCTDEETGEILLRIHNASPVDFKALEIDPYNHRQFIEDLAKNKHSEYFVFETAYHYGYIKLVADGDTLTWLPIDYVGEEPLEAGKHTWHVGLSENKNLTLFYEKD